jgi:protein TonB
MLYGLFPFDRLNLRSFILSLFMNLLFFLLLFIPRYREEEQANKLQIILLYRSEGQEKGVRQDKVRDASLSLGKTRKGGSEGQEKGVRQDKVRDASLSSAGQKRRLGKTRKGGSEGQENKLQSDLVMVHLRDNQPENHQAKRPIPQKFNYNQDLISKAEPPPLKEGFKEVQLETQTSVDTKNQVSEAMNMANKEGISLSSRSEGVKEGATPKRSEPSGNVEEAQFSIISKLVREHLEYPYLARRMGWEGEVLLFFRLNPTGEVEELKVLKSSGFEVLDKSAVNAVKRASKHFPRPNQIVLIKLPIQFKLESGGI